MSHNCKDKNNFSNSSLLDRKDSDRNSNVSPDTEELEFITDGFSAISNTLENRPSSTHLRQNEQTEGAVSQLFQELVLSQSRTSNNIQNLEEIDTDTVVGFLREYSEGRSSSAAHHFRSNEPTGGTPSQQMEYTQATNNIQMPNTRNGTPYNVSNMLRHTDYNQSTPVSNCDLVFDLMDTCEFVVDYEEESDFDNLF